MFGLKLKSWMEAHLGRPRHKSTTHQRRAQKECGASTSSTTNSTSSSSQSSTATLAGGNNPGNIALENNPNFQVSPVSLSSPGEESVSRCEDDSSGHCNQIVTHKEKPEDVVQKSSEVTLSRAPPKGEKTGILPPPVTTSVSNSTSILSGSSFSNSLSSPDTGYSTDGYSPKSVYPAMSFDSSGKSTSTSKSSYTISSLVSSELNSSKLASLSSTASCSVQNGLDEFSSPSPSSPALTSTAYSSSSGISSTTSETVGFPSRGETSLRILQHKKQYSIPEDEDMEKDVIMDSEPIKDFPLMDKNSTKHLPASTAPGVVLDPLQKFSGNLKIDLKSDPLPPSGLQLRTHRRAESMDARTPSHEDYKPLEVEFQDNPPHLGNPLHPPFVLKGTGQIVELSVYKNAYSICSPRRERTRIKTNPWITLNPRNGTSGGKSDIPGGNLCGDNSSLKASLILSPEKEPTRGESSPEQGKQTLEINTGLEGSEHDLEDLEDETCLHDQDSSSSIFRISTSASASDSGKGTLEPGTNRNSTESSCLLSDSASTRNSIISQEADRSGSSGGEEESLQRTPPPLEQEENSNIHQSAVNRGGSGGKVQEEKLASFKNASVATEVSPRILLKSASVSVGVGTTSLNKSGNLNIPPAAPVMVDKETDILSDWGNTDEDGDEEMETDNNDNETVTPAPSSPAQSDLDRGLFSQETSSATDIDFGDSSAATQASSTAVFPPSSLIRRERFGGSKECNGGGNGYSGGRGGYDNYRYQRENIVPQQQIHFQQAVIPIVRPVFQSLEKEEDFGVNCIQPAYSYDIGQQTVLVNPGELVTLQEQNRCFSGMRGEPLVNFNLVEEQPYSEMKKESKGIARGAIGFLRKIFKKGTCSSQRHSPDGKGGGKRGKSDNNLHAVGLGSPLMTISEPLSNPRYSAVLTTKKQMNGMAGYFLTPTPNSFRRRSGAVEFLERGGAGGGGKGSKVKTDIIRLPQGTLSPQQSINHQMACSSHSSGSSCSGGSAPGVVPLQGFIPVGCNNQSNTNTNSTSSSDHSLMSTSTTSGHPRPPSGQKQQIYYSNGQNPRQSKSPPPLIPENSPYSNCPGKIPQYTNQGGNSHSQMFSKSRDLHSQSPSMKAPPVPFESPRLPPPAGKMNSPSFNNYSPIHRLVVTGGGHLLTRGNPSSQNIPCGNNLQQYSCENSQLLQRPQVHPTSSPLINPKYASTASPYPNQPLPSSTPSHFFASPSPILRNPRYQYITSSNQNSPVLNAQKRINVSGPVPVVVPVPHLSTFSPPGGLCQRESLLNNNAFIPNSITTNTISGNLNGESSFHRGGRNVVPSSVSFNEFEKMSYPAGPHHQIIQNTPPILQHHPIPFQPHIIHQPQQQVLHNLQQGKLHQNHYYSSPIVKDGRKLWSGDGVRGGQIFNPGEISIPPVSKEERVRQRINQNLRFNGFLCRNRQLPHFYHTQWGLQERIYETVDSEEDNSPPSDGGGGGDYDGNESELSLPVEVHRRGLKVKQSLSRDFLSRRGEEGWRNGNLEEENEDMSFNHEEGGYKEKRRSKPKSLSASGRPLPRALVALPMMPGTYLSETETRLLERDKDSDKKYKRLINEAEALLKEISVEKNKRSGTSEENFRLEGCPQSDPLRRKAYDCWALRRLQQELAGCCASPPVLHRSRLNLQSPSTPTTSNNPYLSHFQSVGLGPPPLPQQVPYMSSSGVDGNQNSFEF